MRCCAMLLPVLALLGCQGTQVRDLARNSKLYQASGYHAAHRQARTVWIAPLKDRRKARPTHAEGIYPLSYTEDSFWSRPIAEMLDDIVRREIERSGLFRGLAAAPEEADWVLEPSVLEFHGVVEERVVGRAVRGKTALHLTVKGPRKGTGARPVLREETYEAPVATQGMLVLPDPHALAGTSLRRAVGMLLVDLDVGGQMLDGVPAEAGFEPGKKVDWGRRK